jgi:hypothetical protein
MDAALRDRFYPSTGAQYRRRIAKYVPNEKNFQVFPNEG